MLEVEGEAGPGVALPAREAVGGAVPVPVPGCRDSVGRGLKEVLGAGLSVGVAVAAPVAWLLAVGLRAGVAVGQGERVGAGVGVRAGLGEAVLLLLLLPAAVQLPCRGEAEAAAEAVPQLPLPLLPLALALPPPLLPLALALPPQLALALGLLGGLPVAAPSGEGVDHRPLLLGLPLVPAVREAAAVLEGVGLGGSTVRKGTQGLPAPAPVPAPVPVHWLTAPPPTVRLRGTGPGVRVRGARGMSTSTRASAAALPPPTPPTPPAAAAAAPTLLLHALLLLL